MRADFPGVLFLLLKFFKEGKNKAFFIFRQFNTDEYLQQLYIRRCEGL